MALSICQDQDYLGIRRWKWAVWVDGTPEELDSVDHVTYILHPTFHNPVKVVHNRETKFRLEATGWGHLYGVRESHVPEWRRKHNPARSRACVSGRHADTRLIKLPLFELQDNPQALVDGHL